MGSFAEETMSKAKSFLMIYADSFKCVRQAVEKEFIERNRVEFMKKLEVSSRFGEFKVADDGYLRFGSKYGYFFRLNELCQ
jgi:hypothetical protein